MHKKLAKKSANVLCIKRDENEHEEHCREEHDDEGVIWCVWEASWGLLGPLGCLLGTSWGHFGTSWGLLGNLLGFLGALKRGIITHFCKGVRGSPGGLKRGIYNTFLQGF